ncbi:hypothetical protein BDV23DRAFT_77281 [Aspergillus alliaceus]|uniref:Cytochrome P450 n=1 Tax=Petromyces alliaceus TaxID=209559 RepID=A0A5N7C9J7_PETAA|nr:hypothetical protein BDV23DRAFT_77281 [Aspergillus alliaceus]
MQFYCCKTRYDGTLATCPSSVPRSHERGQRSSRAAVATIGAGADAASATLQAFFYYLIRHPRYLLKLLREIDEAHRRLGAIYLMWFCTRRPQSCCLLGLGRVIASSSKDHINHYLYGVVTTLLSTSRHFVFEGQPIYIPHESPSRLHHGTRL